MIPSYFIELEKFPLTANGKVNRIALPAPEIKAGADYVAPSTLMEFKLVEIWSDILNITPDNISLDSDFFSIGGHSLKAAMVVSRLEEELDTKFSLADFFQANTISKMVKIIEVRKMIDEGKVENEADIDTTQIII
jgi:acyl carrier protein